MLQSNRGTKRAPDDHNSSLLAVVAAGRQATHVSRLWHKSLSSEADIAPPEPAAQRRSLLFRRLDQYRRSGHLPKDSIGRRWWETTGPLWSEGRRTTDISRHVEEEVRQHPSGHIIGPCHAHRAIAPGEGKDAVLPRVDRLRSSPSRNVAMRASTSSKLVSVSGKDGTSTRASRAPPALAASVAICTWPTRAGTCRDTGGTAAARRVRSSAPLLRLPPCPGHTRTAEHLQARRCRTLIQ